jgi:hypothetical protein
MTTAHKRQQAVKIPVSAQFIPVSAEEYRAALDANKYAATLTDATVEQLRAGFYIALHLDIDKTRAAYIMLAGCHHIAAWSGKYDLLLGLALGCAYRLTLIAALGEYRHRPNHKRSYRRDQIYESYWTRTCQRIAGRRLEIALDSFLKDPWPLAYGGYSWYKFARWAVRIHNHLLDGNAVAALEALNQVVHSAHNTGWGFNKFIHDSELEKTAQNPVYILLKCAVTLHQVATNVKNAAAIASRFLARRKPIDIAPETHEELTEIPVLNTASTSVEVKDAQAVIKDDSLHIQFKPSNVPGKSYGTAAIPLNGDKAQVKHALRCQPAAESFAPNSSTVYHKLYQGYETHNWYVGGEYLKKVLTHDGKAVA